MELDLNAFTSRQKYLRHELTQWFNIYNRLKFLILL